MRWGWTLLALLLWLVAAAAAHTEGRVALVIGNSAYRNTQALANPRNDAEDVAAALGKLGFSVITGIDLDRAGMAARLASFARAATAWVKRP